MTTNADFDDEPREDAQAAPTREPVPAAQRVWTVFVAFALALVTVLGVQIVLGVALVVWQLANGARLELLAEDLLEMLTDPEVFIGLLLLNQLVIGAAAIVPAFFSPEPPLSRLGLTTPTMSVWGFPIVILGSGLPLAIGLACYYALSLVGQPDQTFSMFYKKISWPLAVPWVLFVSLAPGFMEELFFRGYMQRRLLQRWGPWLAILISAALFALLHMSPHTVVFAFPIGIWLGIVAWRTGSVWLAMICHASINASGSIHEIGMHLADWPEVPPLAVSVSGGAAVIVCFLGSLWLLARSQPAPAIQTDAFLVEASNPERMAE